MVDFRHGNTIWKQIGISQILKATGIKHDSEITLYVRGDEISGKPHFRSGFLDDQCFFTIGGRRGKRFPQNHQEFYNWYLGIRYGLLCYVVEGKGCYCGWRYYPNHKPEFFAHNFPYRISDQLDILHPMIKRTYANLFDSKWGGLHFLPDKHSPDTILSVYRPKITTYDWDQEKQTFVETKY